MITATTQKNQPTNKVTPTAKIMQAYVGNIKIPFQELLYCPKFSKEFQLYMHLICKIFMNIIF